MSRWMVVGVVGLVACAPDSEVTGPYSGEIRRYQIDDFRMPRSDREAAGYGADLTGDGSIDNSFGFLTGLLGQTDNLSSPRDVIASGVVNSYLELQADDLEDDDTVALWYVGEDGDAATAIGARLSDGDISSNRFASTVHLPKVRARIPIFIDADPTTIDLFGLEIDLESDHVGGFNGVIRGGVSHGDALEATYQGISHMLSENPGGHRGLRYLFDFDLDGVLTRDDIIRTSLVSWLAPDIEQSASGPLVSFAFGVHLRDCRGGTCRPLAAGDTCRDRVIDRDETDLDCGGACLPCAGGRACIVDGDCDSGTCASGTCTAPSCSDGIENGFESDVDCGGACGVKCTIGRRCVLDFDCATQNCVEKTGLCT